MKNILAENLLRFGVKNLSESDLYRISQSKLLTEGEVGTIQKMPPLDLNMLRANKAFSDLEGKIKTFISTKKIPFSIPDASAYLTIYFCNRDGNEETSKLIQSGNTKKLLNRLIERNSIADGDSFFSDVTTQIIQLNEHPDSKGMVLTVGTITPTAYNTGDANGASKISDIVTFMNDHNLTNAIANPRGGNGIFAEPFKMGKVYGKGTSFVGGSFINGAPGKDPGAGAFDISEAAGSWNYDSAIYSTSTFEAASAKTGAQTITDVIFTPGPELKSELGNELFQKTTITPNPGLVQRIQQAIDGAKALGTILGARIESGASFDEPVDYDRAQFAGKVGLPADKVPVDPKKDNEGVVTDPMSGGNAFLAHYRGVALKNELAKLLPGIETTIKATVAKGLDKARFANIYFKIQKPDDTTEITRQDVATIGKGAVSSDLGGLFQIVRYDI